MTAASVARALKRYWAALLALLLFGGIVGAVAAIVQTPSYASTARVIVTFDAPAATGASELLAANNLAVQRAGTYVDIVTSPRVLQPVIDDLGLEEETTASLARKVTVEVPAYSAIVAVTATATDAAASAELTNAIVDSFSSFIVDDIESSSAAAPSAVRIITLESALVPDAPASPIIPLYVGLGLFVGLAIALVFLPIAAWRDRGVYTRDDVVEATGLRVVGATPHPAKGEGLVVVDAPAGRAAEAYRSARAFIAASFVDERGVVLVAEPAPDTGTSVAAANLAASFAESGARTLLLDADGATSPGTGIDLPGGTGLGDLLAGTATVTEVLVKDLHGVPGLDYIPAGSDRPGARTAGETMRALVKELGTTHDVLVINAPPLLSYAEGTDLARVADVAVIAVRVGAVDSIQLSQVVTGLQAVPALTIETLLTDVPAKGVNADPAAAAAHRAIPA